MADHMRTRRRSRSANQEVRKGGRPFSASRAVERGPALNLASSIVRWLRADYEWGHPPEVTEIRARFIVPLVTLGEVKEGLSTSRGRFDAANARRRIKTIGREEEATITITDILVNQGRNGRLISAQVASDKIEAERQQALAALEDAGMRNVHGPRIKAGLHLLPLFVVTDRIPTDQQAYSRVLREGGDPGERLFTQTEVASSLLAHFDEKKCLTLPLGSVHVR